VSVGQFSGGSSALIVCHAGDAASGRASSARWACFWASCSRRILGRSGVVVMAETVARRDRLHHNIFRVSMCTHSSRLSRGTQAGHRKRGTGGTTQTPPGQEEPGGAGRSRERRAMPDPPTREAGTLGGRGLSTPRPTAETHDDPSGVAKRSPAPASGRKAGSTSFSSRRPWRESNSVEPHWLSRAGR
jgi:hypothetical protein